MISPAGVVMPRPMASGIEWQTWKVSIWKGPNPEGLAGLDGMQDWLYLPARCVPA